MSIVVQAIEAAGGVVKLAKACGNLHHTSVICWRRADRIPAGQVVAVEAATGIPREQLRPDLYRITPQPAEQAAA